MTDPVLTDFSDGVLTVTLNNPSDNNRMDRRTMAAIVAAIDRAATDKTVRVIVVTGADPYFCGGGRPDGHPAGVEEAGLVGVGVIGSPVVPQPVSSTAAANAAASTRPTMAASFATSRHPQYAFGGHIPSPA